MVYIYPQHHPPFLEKINNGAFEGERKGLTTTVYIIQTLPQM